MDDYENRLQEKKSELAEEYGEENVFTTRELEEKFNIQHFLMPECFGVNRETGERVRIYFTGSPRVYYNPRPWN